MNKLGFKNFRRFTELSPLSIGSLTLLSGGNNSGKSTIVKAAMLAINYLKTPKINANTIINMRQYRKFFFDIENVYVSSFSRAINNDCNLKSDSIQFTVQLGEFIIDIEVKASDSVISAYGLVSLLKINDVIRHIKYTYVFDKSPSMTIDFTDSEEDENNAGVRESIIAEISQNEEILKSSKDFQAISMANDKLSSLKKRLENLESEVEEPVFTFPLSTFSDDQNPFFVTHLIASFVGVSRLREMSKDDEKKYKSAKLYIKSREKDIALSILSLVDIISAYKFEYIAAHAASQRAFYTTYDTSDYTAQTVHDFFNSGVGNSDSEGCITIDSISGKNHTVPEKLILKYMKLFNIGSGIRIKSFNNESYTVDIIDEKAKVMPLADKGMGSIQLTILLLRIALLMKKYEFSSHNPIILVEEPEQNLHPKTQSLLADFFYEISTAFKFQMLVETHSEYLVRKMQVIFASKIKEEEKNEDELNDIIKVYFFPEESSPYLMTFLKNGRFENTFGSGFFDEAGRWNRELNKMERQ